MQFVSNVLKKRRKCMQAYQVQFFIYPLSISRYSI